MSFTEISDIVADIEKDIIELKTLGAMNYRDEKQEEEFMSKVYNCYMDGDTLMMFGRDLKNSIKKMVGMKDDQIKALGLESTEDLT